MWSTSQAWGTLLVWCFQHHTKQFASIYWTILSRKVDDPTLWTWLIVQGLRFSSNYVLSVWCFFGLYPFLVLTHLIYVNRSFKCINAWHMLRLAILYLLRAKPNDFACHIALKCASFSKMNIRTSCRSPCTPYGYEDYASVKLANMLMERRGWCHFASVSEGMLAIVSINFDWGFWRCTLSLWPKSGVVCW